MSEYILGDSAIVQRLLGNTQNTILYCQLEYLYFTLGVQECLGLLNGPSDHFNCYNCECFCNFSKCPSPYSLSDIAAIVNIALK